MTVPPSLKTLSPFLALSKQFSSRNPVVSYYCMMYFVQQGIPQCKGDAAAKAYLSSAMQQLEEKKRSLSGDEALQNEIVAVAAIEEVALTYFDTADRKDRSAQHDIALSKLFYVCGRLFQILEQFGELSEEIADKMKYSKWKALDIKRCLDNGITPTPGPPGGLAQNDEVNPGDEDTTSQPPPYGFSDTPHYPGVVPPSDDLRPVPAPRRNIPSPNASPVAQRRVDPVPPPSASYNPSPYPPTVNVAPSPSSYVHPQPVVPPPSGTVQLTTQQISQVQKYCKFAASSMDYDDRSSAIDNLENALKLLRTGQ